MLCNLSTRIITNWFTSFSTFIKKLSTPLSYIIYFDIITACLREECLCFIRLQAFPTKVVEVDSVIWRIILRKRIVDLSSYIPVVFIMYNEVSYQVVLICELGESCLASWGVSDITLTIIVSSTVTVSVSDELFLQHVLWY